MIYIEMPLWVVICWFVATFIVIIYLSFGDFLAHLLYKYLMNKEKEEKESKDE